MFLTAWLYALILGSLIGLAGCASSTGKPGATPSQSSLSPQPSPSSKAPEAGGSVRESGTGSLDALREGRAAEGGPLKEIYFDYDRYDLAPDARETLKGHADWLKKNPSARVEIEGHADNRGTNEYNLALGAKRAQSAKDYLVTLGMAGDRLSTISYGEEVPVCKEENEACWQKNRRARFVVSAGKPAS